MPYQKGDVIKVTDPAAPYSGCEGEVDAYVAGARYPVEATVLRNGKRWAVSYREDEVQRLDQDAPHDQIPAVH